MRNKGDLGFTLIEITIILLVLVILAAILLPMTERFIDLARLVRVREDIGAFAAVVEIFKVDTCDSFFRVDGDEPSNADFNRIDMLVGDGDTPATESFLSGAEDNWDEVLDAVGPSGDVLVDTIENHLALGGPFGPSGWGDPYRRPAEDDANPFRCGWRGAYIQTPISADPWGNRYMINVAFLGHAGGRPFGLNNDAEFHQQDVFVLSAGPDEIVATPWLVDGVVAQGDDQIAVISGSSL